MTRMALGFSIVSRNLFSQRKVGLSGSNGNIGDPTKNVRTIKGES